MRRIMSTGTAAVRRHNLHRLDFSIASALPVGATKNALLPDIALFHHCELVQIEKKTAVRTCSIFVVYPIGGLSKIQLR